MKPFVIPISLLLSFTLERWITFFFPSFFFMPSIVFFVATLWFIGVSISTRVSIALATGFFLDSVSLLPFGTYTSALLCFVLLSLFFQANSAPSLKRFEKPVWGTSTLILIPIVLMGVSSLLSRVGNDFTVWRISEFVFIFFTGIAWSAAFFFISMTILFGFHWRKRIG